MGVAVGGAGLVSSAPELLVPYVNQPQNTVPGVSTWYATSCRECPAGCGMVARNVQSRVVKCEGNPIHPISGGRLCARGQAAVMGLYDPDRVKKPQRRTRGGFEDASWDDALRAVGRELGTRQGVAIISDLQTGTLDALMRQWLGAFGSERLVVYEPIDYAPVKALFGGVVPSFDIAASDYVLSFGADFLENWVSPVEYARGFAEMREPRDGRRGGFAYVGHRVSATGASADVRILVPPGAMVDAARAIRAQMGGESAAASELERRWGVDPESVRLVAEGLSRAVSPLVLPGWYSESAEAVRALGVTNGSGTVDTGRPHAVTAIGGEDEITGLIDAMEAGEVEVLVIHGANPVYSLPDPQRFLDALKRVPVAISLSSFMDETSAQAHWILPSNTPLESWGDYAPYPDVANLMQPTMASVYDTRNAGDILMQIARAARGAADGSGARTYRDYLLRRWGGAAGAAEWETALARGGRWAGQEGNATPSTGYQSLAEASFGSARPLPAAATPPAQRPTPAAPTTAAGVSGWGEDEVRLYAFPHIYYYDGRNANRRWLQEIPEPVTKAVWGSWAEIHPETAKRLGIRTDDCIEIASGDRRINVSAFVWDGVARNTVAVPVGEGHEHYGRFASDVGVNVYPLLAQAEAPVTVSKAGGRKWITRIKGSRYQHGREIVQGVRLDEDFERDRPITMPLPEGYGENDFYPGHEHVGHRWAMVVDLNRCVGCHACVTACYAENNIGVVGPEGIYRRREMSWLRIDLYYQWSSRFAPVLFQPMLCQHCDAAPCEPVCPVFAASHSEEGLNMQIYNRCVGTRYCSNNCPYKVRRFNWFDYAWPEPLNWQLNPDVTVRCRGVMEKCTFCIQRIRQAEIVAKREGRPVRDGEITPACVATCPTGVFTFGDLMDPESRVSRLIREDPRAYQVLGELNTKTAVIYLRKVVGTAVS